MTEFAEYARNGQPKLIPLLSFGCAMLGLMIVAFTTLFELLIPLFFVGAIVGAIWGNYLSRKIVHRSRIRSRISYACYRCKNCDKLFRVDTPNAKA